MTNAMGRSCERPAGASKKYVAAVDPKLYEVSIRNTGSFGFVQDFRIKVLTGFGMVR